MRTHCGAITLNDSIVMKARKMKDMIAVTMPEPTVRRRLAAAIPIDVKATVNVAISAPNLATATTSPAWMPRMPE